MDGLVHETSGGRREDGVRLWAAAGQAYQIAFRATDSREAAEDAVQQAFLVALSELPAGLSASEVRLWFFRVVTNAAGNLRRSELRRRGRETLVMQERGNKGSPSGAGSDLVGALRRAMENLDAKYRLPVALCYEQGLTQNEAAGVLRMPARTVSKYVNVGLEKLRKALERAGYPAAVAAVLGGLKSTAPVVPASLAGRVEALVAQGAAKTGAGAAAASVSAAAKGGIAMKLIAGVILAGAVAAGVAMVAPKRGTEPLPAEALPGPVKEHAPDEKYRLVPAAAARSPEKGAYLSRGMIAGILNGPGLGAEYTSTSDAASDGRGNAYWTAAGTFPIVRRWSVGDDRVVTVAGSATGHLDGPLSRARFGGWGGGGYSPGGIEVSRDGRHGFVREPHNEKRLRHIDLDSGKVSTLGKGLTAVRDRTGEVYVLNLGGGAVPPGKGYKTLKIPKLQIAGHSLHYALDAAGGRLYYHVRGPLCVADLKTGKCAPLSWDKGSRAKKRKQDVTGPLEGMLFHCPVGLSISPGGRYLYVGGGDSCSFYRIDLEKKYVHVFARDAADTYSFQDGTERDQKTRISVYPTAAFFADDGSAVWGAQGIFRLVPTGRGR